MDSFAAMANSKFVPFTGVGRTLLDEDDPSSKPESMDAFAAAASSSASQGRSPPLRLATGKVLLFSDFINGRVEAEQQHKFVPFTGVGKKLGERGPGPKSDEIDVHRITEKLASGSIGERRGTKRPASGEMETEEEAKRHRVYVF